MRTKYHTKCPHCGTTNTEHFSDNGCREDSLDLTLLCLAPVADGEEAFDEVSLEHHPEARRQCGNQWNPNELQAEDDADREAELRWQRIAREMEEDANEAR